MRRAPFACLVLAACGSRVPAPVTEQPGTSPPAPPVATAPLPVTIGPPATRKVDVKDTFHGTVVADPYRWLEETTPEADTWSAAQSTYAEKAIAASPELAKLRAEYATIYRAPSTLYTGFAVAGTQLFATRKLAAQEQAQLVALADPAKPETATVVFDPNATANAAIDWFVPSPDGKLVAVAVYSGGSEVSDLHVVDRSGEELEVIPNVSRATASGSVAWTHDSKGFYYTRYPTKGEDHDDELNNWQQVWFHTRDTPIGSDRRELGPELTKVSQVRLFANARDVVLAVVQNGDSGPVRSFVRRAKGWQVVAEWNDQVPWVSLGKRDDLWLVSTKDAPHGKVLHMPIGGTLAKATTVIAEGTDSIDSDFYADRGVLDTGDRIHVPYQIGGPSEVRSFTRSGGSPTRVPLPLLAATSTPVWWNGSLLVGASTHTTPFTWYRVTGAKAVALDAISRHSPVDLSGFEATREAATSKDGTKVPYTVIARKGAPRDGTRRCIATGYGGFGISMEPSFVEWAGPLLSRDVCIVIANLRGGGELGAAWHRAGMLERKQNVFDDFIAVVDDIVAKKITARDRVAITGASNGGLLMGAVLTQRPDIAKAVVIEVGVLDSLRYELSPNGATNTPEYGTVREPSQFNALYAYSPVHNVRPARYPATLLMTGKNDGRVLPANSYKMTAALQAAQRGDAPILLRVAEAAGHGFGTGTNERVEQAALADAFVLTQLAH